MFKNYRRYPRYPIYAKAVITRLNSGSQERLTTQVNNISQGGMGVYTQEHMKKNTPVSVKLLFHGMAAEDILEGRIASVCPQENDYFVGIAFNLEIPYDRFVEIVSME